MPTHEVGISFKNFFPFFCLYITTNRRKNQVLFCRKKYGIENSEVIAMQKKESMTALLSLFARAWHNERYAVRVLEDDVSRKLLSDEEYRTVGAHMANGISFFAPQFSGTNEQALRLIATEYLCP